MANEYNRDNMIKAIEEHAKGHIAQHAMNVEVYPKNPRCWRTSGYEAIEKELAVIAQYPIN